MNFNEYKNKSMKTNGCGKKINYFIYALNGEVGEFVDVIKKHLYHTHDLDKTELLKEAGDIMWAMAYFENFVDGRIDSDKVDEYDKMITSSNYRNNANFNRIYNFSKSPRKSVINQMINVAVLEITAYAGQISDSISDTLSVLSLFGSSYADVVNTFDVIRTNGSGEHLRSIRVKLEKMLSLISFVVYQLTNETLETAMIMNIEKLQKRYGNGFSSEKSIKRVDIND